MDGPTTTEPFVHMAAKERRLGASDSKEEGGVLDVAGLNFTRVEIWCSAAVPAGVKKRMAVLGEEALAGPAPRASWIAAGSSGGCGTSAASSLSSSVELDLCPLSCSSLLGAWRSRIGRQLSLLLAASSCLKRVEDSCSRSGPILVTRLTLPELF